MNNINNLATVRCK